VARTGRPLLVTKNGKPVAELRPYRPAPGSALGILKGKATITGDIMSPIEADRDASK
jgi:antitoxin (DNA-binding transcriptional repressor) of toxin-antitoxin stability system